MRCSYVHMYIPLKSHAPAIIFSKDLFVWWFTWQVALRKCHIIFIFAALFVHFVSDLLIFVILCQLMRQSRYFGPRRRRRRVRKANVGIEWLGQVLRVLSPHSFVSWPASLLYSRAELQLHICSHAKKWKVTGLSWAIQISSTDGISFWTSHTQISTHHWVSRHLGHLEISFFYALLLYIWLELLSFWLRVLG